MTSLPLPCQGFLVILLICPFMTSVAKIATQIYPKGKDDSLGNFFWISNWLTVMFISWINSLGSQCFCTAFFLLFRRKHPPVLWTASTFLNLQVSHILLVTTGFTLNQNMACFAPEMFFYHPFLFCLSLVLSDNSSFIGDWRTDAGWNTCILWIADGQIEKDCSQISNVQGKLMPPFSSLVSFCF